MPNQPTINKGQLATHYGYALAFLNSDHELKHLFNQAVKNTWTTDRFVAGLRNTKWFKNNSAAVRNAIMQKTSDPATWQENVDKMHATVTDEWERMFGQATPAKKSELKQWAETAQTLGWSQSQLVDHMVQSVNLSSLLTQKNTGGVAADSQNQIQQLASQYGVDMGNSWVTNRVKGLLDGNGSIGGIQAQLKNQAKQTYSAYADRLDAGETMQDIADPYVQKMSSLLETDPNGISLQNGMIQKALTARNPATGQASPMNLSDFSNLVRSDPRWQYTTNAKQSMADTISSLGQSWGLA